MKKLYRIKIISHFSCINKCSSTSPPLSQNSRSVVEAHLFTIFPSIIMEQLECCGSSPVHHLPLYYYGIAGVLLEPTCSLSSLHYYGIYLQCCQRLTIHHLRLHYYGIAGVLLEPTCSPSSPLLLWNSWSVFEAYLFSIFPSIIMEQLECCWSAR